MKLMNMLKIKTKNELKIMNIKYMCYFKIIKLIYKGLILARKFLE